MPTPFLRAVAIAWDDRWLVCRCRGDGRPVSRSLGPTRSSAHREEAFSRRFPAYRGYGRRVRRARHSADGGRIAPGSLLDVADDWMLLVFGVPFVLGVMALWEWQPVVAVALVGTTVTGVLIGVVVLLRRREVESWGHALAALLALSAAGALLIVVSDL